MDGYFIIVNNFKTLWCIGKPYYFMKSLLISVVFILLSGVIYTQTSPIVYENCFVRTVSKEGKETTKGITAHVTGDYVYFETSSTAHYIVGRRPSGEWAQIKNDRSWGAIVERVVQDNGLIVFHVNEKKAFYYRP